MSAVVSVAGTKGKVKIEERVDYESFKLENNEMCVRHAEAAILAVGGNPTRAITNGGLDANWLTERGVPTVTMGCGQENVHTVHERLHIASFETACRIALRLATATENLSRGA